MQKRKRTMENFRKKLSFAAVAVYAVCVAVCCERVDKDVRSQGGDTRTDNAILMEDVARLLSSVNIGEGQMGEVHDAVTSSSVNGYDEEYTMENLFSDPGAGVGDSPTRAGAPVYRTPLRDLLRAALSDRFGTKAGEDSPEVDAYIENISSSGVQIYWPFSEEWDGTTSPIITYDPCDNSARNVGYAMGDDGKMTEVIVDEDIARERPVWVVNRNDDAGFKSLEMLRREDPDWGTSGGTITVKASSSEDKTLILRSFVMKRNYDTWFAGASEFFVKCGSIAGFKATTEQEMRLYSPTVTDFMIVVRRNQAGTEIPFNAVLASEWTDQVNNCAFIITEDDGGTRTTWKSSAVVKYNSKAYGIDIEIPITARDDIVWRGQLSRSYIERFNGQTGHFGDVDLVLELI